MRNVIFAGHYCVSEEFADLGPSSDVELATWESGVKRFAENQESSKLVLWVNDIGISKESRRELKEKYVIPLGYADTLIRYGIPEKVVIVDFESSVRNKASSSVRGIAKKDPSLLAKIDSSSSDLTRCIDNSACQILREGEKYSYVLEGPQGESIVVKDGPNPKCNMILAALFEKHVDGDATVFNYFNAIYRRRVDLGIYVYRKLLKGEAQFRNEFHDFMKNKIIELH